MALIVRQRRPSVHEMHVYPEHNAAGSDMNKTHHTQSSCLNEGEISALKRLHEVSELLVLALLYSSRAKE